jgi:hypothetical protein
VRAASAQALALEKGMIILSTAVAGKPFSSLFGAVGGKKQQNSSECP